MLTVIYTYYYCDPAKADIYRYFNDSLVITRLIFHHPVVWLKVISGVGINEAEVFRHLLPTLYFSHPESDIATCNAFLIRTVSLLNYFSLSNIYIDTLILNFFSFIGFTFLFKAFKIYFKEFPFLLCAPIYLLPSVVFWSSSILKEQLVFTFIGPFFFLLLNSKRKLDLKLLVLSCLFLCIQFYIKPFVAFSLIPVLLLLTVARLKNRNLIYLLLSTIVLVIAIALMLQPSFYTPICEQLVHKRNEFVALAISENAGSYFDGKFYPSDCSHLLFLIPKALLSAIFRPFVWERGSAFQTVLALENMFVFLIVLFVLVRYFKLVEREKSIVAISIFIFALLNYLIIGITVPITGAIVHYRIIATPFLVIGILFFVDIQKVKATITRFVNSAFFRFK